MIYFFSKNENNCGRWFEVSSLLVKYSFPWWGKDFAIPHQQGLGHWSSCCWSPYPLIPGCSLVQEPPVRTHGRKQNSHSELWAVTQWLCHTVFTDLCRAVLSWDWGGGCAVWTEFEGIWSPGAPEIMVTSSDSIKYCYDKVGALLSTRHWCQAVWS